MSRRDSLRMIALATLAGAAPTIASPAQAQVDVEFATDGEAVVLRLSNPWSPDPDALTTAAGPAGLLSNRGPEPVFFVMFAQPVLGFESGEIHVTGTESVIRIEGPTSHVALGPERPIWLRGVLPAGEAVALGDLDVRAEKKIMALLREERLQVGFLVVARRGAVSVALEGLSPLGAEAPDPGRRGLLYPHEIQLEGGHDLAEDLFTSPATDEPPNGGTSPGAAEDVESIREE